MEKKAKTNPKIKLALAIAVPVMVMVVTIAMVGASFAWFTDKATTEVSTITLTTRDVFSLSFRAGEGDTSVYSGQTAFALSKNLTSDTNTAKYLICNYRAKNLGYLSNEFRYLDDLPFSFRTTVNIDSDNRYVDFNIDFDWVAMIKNTTIMDKYGDYPYDPAKMSVQNEYSKGLIPYLFTWYIKRAGVENTYIYYTPYGIIQTSESGGVETAIKVNGEDVDATNTSILDSSKSNYLQRNGVTDFGTNGSEAFDIYVVFCPEKAYWAQYFPADRDKPLDGTGGIYTSTEIGYMTRANSMNSIYYSNSMYFQSVFSFSANMTVSRVDWDREVNKSAGE